MSIWTHVVGAIRFDGLSGMTPEPQLGRTVGFDDERALWDECNVPCGSEGSLEYTMTTNPDDSQMARYAACIFGDLRDYDDDEEIISYFNRITSGMMVRGGAFCIDCESRDTRTFAFINDEWNEC